MTHLVVARLEYTDGSSQEVEFARGSLDFCFDVQAGPLKITGENGKKFSDVRVKVIEA